MTGIKDVLEKAIFKTYTTDEIKDGVKSVRLGDIDKKYVDFAIEQGFMDYGDIYFYHVSLFLIEYDGHLVPLVVMSNVAYNPEEVIEEMAKVIQRILKQEENRLS